MTFMTPNRPLLAIDTAAPRLQLALLTADGRVDVLVDEIDKGHAELVFARIDTLLRRNGLVYKDLRRIAVTTGPGSFTGLRIGMSAAHGVGLALDVSVVGVPSLLALSLSAPEGSNPAVLLDARREEAYIQTFSAPGVPVSDAAILPMEEAKALTQGHAPLLETPFVDIGHVALLAQTLDAAAYPPLAAYVRGPDAKPQDKARVARVGAEHG